MKRRNILIVFAKNPEHGKVKTRLAATIGADAALEVYKQLLLHTRCIAAKTEADKIVFYSGMVANED
ncbi:MAG TPA: hypothetical protein VER36_11275, partial [Flavisolibacter sp.]|nr:hypothetical protein [Flavisolibacter sp.]